MSYPQAIPSVSAYAGDTLVFPQYSFQTDGLPTDLSEWTNWTAQWRPDPYSEEVIPLELTQVVSSFTPLATAENTRAMEQSGVWDLQATNTLSGFVRTWIRGQVILRMDVTRG